MKNIYRLSVCRSYFDAKTYIQSKTILTNYSKKTIVIEPLEFTLLKKDLPTLRLRLKKPKSKKQVKWGEDTVDNEHLNKKKSKCCCIYNKPRAFGESSDSDSNDECDNCQGHVERRKKARSQGGGDHPHPGGDSSTSPPPLVPA